MSVEMEIGWQVVDADGNVIDSGPISIAEMTGEMRELLGLPTEGDN